mmetsp:Transcript_64/g.194  ORF Transcript_64/g.194 Transcript_64/m.194 type:complete len:112 (+) Transcript_64:204-539(+)|eukprot:CAMPEP_0184711598 /NCGR_PEP_ID=MMETSP0314-20130426/2235_2 /TAXON_ID=38298 /ORGANISM="Rhodella maculata, Strain CCMP 736" /LENGTH=111 /DNA_ID=CAMNT_0027173771 /DNA_START=161 /DNA_END=496 /DNA_ORIENTATION=-
MKSWDGGHPLQHFLSSDIDDAELQELLLRRPAAPAQTPTTDIKDPHVEERRRARLRSASGTGASAWLGAPEYRYLETNHTHAEFTTLLRFRLVLSLDLPNICVACKAGNQP